MLSVAFKNSIELMKKWSVTELKRNVETPVLILLGV